jgi:hypothetical protein
MKRLLVSLLVCLLVSLSFVGVSHAQAIGAPVSSQPADLMEQLKAQFLPQMESILTPAQRDRLASMVTEEKASLRKAFKLIALTPDQKHQLASVFKSLPQKGLFASMTPEQKKQFFMKKEFAPTPEEITEKITAGMKSKGAVVPEGLSEKIGEKMKMKETFMPKPEAITEKIKAGMEAIKEQMED